MAVAASSLLLVPLPGAAQTLQGRVLDIETDRPLVSTLVQLYDAVGGVRAAVVADDAGRYRLEAPEPGRYRLGAQRLGYEEYRSETVELRRAGADYAVDLLLSPTPIELAGLEVTAEGRARVERAVKQIIGLDVASLRFPVIHKDEIGRHEARGNGPAELVQGQGFPNLWIQWQSRAPPTPCFLYRGRSCLPVYLDGLRLRAETVQLIPLGSLEAVSIIVPTDSVLYPEGAVLLHTTGAIGR